MNQKKLEFVIFCMEVFRNEYRLTGRQTLELFKKYDVITYIQDNYDILHSYGAEFLCEEIAELVGYADDISAGIG